MFILILIFLFDLNSLATTKAERRKLNEQFLQAAARSDLNQMKELLSKPVKPNINALNKFGLTALHEAVWLNNLEVVQFLLENNANPNAGSQSRQRPLHLAATNGSARLVSMLVKFGARLDAKCSYSDETPLHNAAIKCNGDTLRALVEFGADVNAVDTTGKTPLNRLFALDQSKFDSKMVEVASTLMLYGAKTDNLPDPRFNPKLHSFVSNRRNVFKSSYLKKFEGFSTLFMYREIGFNKPIRFKKQ